MQIWTNVWKKTETSTLDSNPYYTAAKNSYEEAMDDLCESGVQFSLPSIRYNNQARTNESCQQTYNYLCTQFSRFEKSGKLLEAKTYTDLSDEIENWCRAREEENVSYRAAATLSMKQLCKLGS